MDIWFMYDNHRFKRIGDPATENRHDLECRIVLCFAEDGFGVVFFKETQKAKELELWGHKLSDGKNGITADEVKEFFDKVDERINWLARG